MRRPAPGRLRPPPTSGQKLALPPFVANLVRFVPGGELTVGVLLIVAVVGAFAGLTTIVLHSERSRQDVMPSAAVYQPAARLTAAQECEWKWGRPQPGGATRRPKA